MALTPPVDRHDHTEARSRTTSAPQGTSGNHCADHVPRIDTRDWRRLGRAQQRFFQTGLSILEVVNLTLADLLTGPARQQPGELAPQMTDRLDALEQNHRRRHQCLQQLHRRLDLDDPDLRRFVAEQVRMLLGRMSPVDMWEEAANPTALVLTIDTVVSGALVDTTYQAVGQVLGEEELLPSLGDFFESRRSDNREGLQGLHPLLRRLRTVSATASMVESTFDRSVLPCVEFTRTVQRRFDCVGLGLLPDEMVTRVLDRIFEMTARSKPAG
jgi:hypothetical protein